MRMGKPFVCISAALAVGAIACTESISAPGTCPAFCPEAQIQMIDTVLTDVIELDTSFTGYVLSHEAIAMQVAGDGSFRSRGLIRFSAFPEEIPIDTANTAPVASIDSFRLDMLLRRRSPGSGLEVQIHRVPLTIDSLTTYDDIADFFDDSTRVGTLSVPDDVTESDTVSAVLPGDAFPNFDEDGRQGALGLTITANDGFVTLGTREASLPALLTRFAQATVDDTTIVPGSDLRTATFDTFVHRGDAPPRVGTLAIGGVPSSRAFFRFDIPSSIIDESDIVTATLLLVPVEPVFGAAGDSLDLVGNGVGADFGPKSPVVPGAVVDSLAVRGAAAIGSVDTVAINITTLVGQWQNSESQPRTLVLRGATEAAGPAQLLVGTSRSAAARPALRLTFIPAFSFVQR